MIEHYLEHTPIPAAQTRSLAQLLDALRSRYAIAPSRVHTHREIRPRPTACPGEGLQRWVDSYRLSAATLTRQSSSTSPSTRGRSSDSTQPVSRASLSPEPRSTGMSSGR